MKNIENCKSSVNYNRVMSEDFEKELMSQYAWLIDFVKRHDCLDFQTGANKGKSWFSIYRGTSRILRLSKSGKAPIKIDADPAYIKLSPNITNKELLNSQLLETYLSDINSNTKFERYYVSSKRGPREGFFQNLIARRYTLNLKASDDFVIIDKELVIGFDKEETKEQWNSDIITEQNSRIANARQSLAETKLSEDIKAEYGEFDFLAIDKKGNFIIMELKQDDATKTYLSPIQANYYVLQFQKLLREKRESVCNAVKDMFEQKVRMGMINPPNGWSLPAKFNCDVKAYLIVGNTTGISEEIGRRFRYIRREVLPSITAYQTKKDGTIEFCSQLNKTKYARYQESLLFGSKLFANRTDNLYPLIKDEVLNYMHENSIAWWCLPFEKPTTVTAHKLSSQVACINHLFPLRQNAEAVLSIIQPIGKTIGVHFDEVLPVFNNDINKGFITFEFVFNNKELLHETHESRGTNCTSIDALIYARSGQQLWIIPIEWKYTEAYDSCGDAYNYERYKNIISPQSRIETWHNLYKRDPFYELGRQTLLTEKIIEKKQIEADQFLHLVVVPKGNTEMREDADKFCSSLKQETRHLLQIVDPQQLLLPLKTNTKYTELTNYLQTRYWN